MRTSEGLRDSRLVREFASVASSISSHASLHSHRFDQGAKLIRCSKVEER